MVRRFIWIAAVLSLFSFPTPVMAQRATSPLKCGAPETCFAWSEKHGVAICIRECGIGYCGELEGTAFRVYADNLIKVGGDEYTFDLIGQCSTVVAKIDQLATFESAAFEVIKIKDPQGRGTFSAHGVKVTIGAKKANITTDDGREASAAIPAIRKFEGKWQNVPTSLHIARKQKNGSVLGIVIFFDNKDGENDCVENESVISIALPPISGESTPALLAPAKEAEKILSLEEMLEQADKETAAPPPVVSQDPKELSKKFVQQGMEAFKWGNYPLARKYFLKAKELNPADSWIDKYLEKVNEKIGAQK